MLSFFHVIKVTTMPVPCIIIKLSYKMSRYPLIEVYTKLLLAAIKLLDSLTNRVSDSHSPLSFFGP